VIARPMGSFWRIAFRGFLVTGMLFGLLEIARSIGITYGTPPPYDFYFYKGQKAALFGYGAVNVPDEDGDGVARIYNYVGWPNSFAHEHHWYSLRRTYQADAQMIPFQNEGSTGSNLYLDASHMVTGQTYLAASYVCSEVAGGGSVGTRTCVGMANRNIHIIPYPIPVYQCDAVGGTFSKILIRWGEPRPLYWNLHHYALLQRDVDSIRINGLDSALVLQTGISLTDTGYQVRDAPRGIRPFYAIVGYDSLGEAIALSASVQPGYAQGAFSLLSPADGSPLPACTVNLDWTDKAGASSYSLWYSTDSTFSTKEEISGIVVSSYVLNLPATDHQHYYWRVIADDGSCSDEAGWRFGINVVNVAPDTPTLLLPADGTTASSRRAEFTWSASTDPGDNVTYTIRIARDAAFTNLVSETQTPHPWLVPGVPLGDDSTFWWDVRATDSGGATSGWSPASSLTIHQPDPPCSFELLFPKWNYNIDLANEYPVETDLMPTFSWRRAVDSDPGSSVTYELWYGTDSTFNVKTVVSSIIDTFYTPAVPLEEDRYYYWRVIAVDNTGKVATSYGLPYAFVTNAANRSPVINTLFSPVRDTIVAPNQIMLRWAEPAEDLYDSWFCDLIVSRSRDFSDTAYQATNLLYYTQQTIPRLNRGRYYWKVLVRSLTMFGEDGGSGGSAIDSFTVFYDITGIQSPTAGEILYAGGTVSVFWTAINVPTVRIDFSSDGGQTWTPEGSASSKPFPWTVPSSITSEGMIRVLDNQDETVWRAMDGTFHVRTGTITLGFSLRGEEWMVGTDHEITWQAENVELVRLQYSPDGGGSWITFRDSLSAASGKFVWTVTPDAAGNALIRVTEERFTNISAVSDTMVRILPMFEQAPVSLPGFGSSMAAWGDYNNDGKLDLALGGYHWSHFSIKLFENSGQTLIESQGSLPGLYWGSLAWGDYDNDGDVDLLATGNNNYGNGGSSIIYRNNTGAFADVGAAITGVHRGNGVFGDLDNDGLLDVVVTGMQGGRFSQATQANRNNHGTFSLMASSLLAAQESDVAIADFNNDGDMDLVVAGETQDYLGNNPLTRLYENHDGILLDTNIPLLNARYSALAWGDYDCDGDLDLLISGLDQSTIYRNDNGTFVDIHPAIVRTSSMTSAAWADLDNDGDLDLIIALAGVSVFRNDNGTFKPISVGIELFDRVAVGDYDGDGDLDIVTSGNYQTRLHRNLVRRHNTPPLPVSTTRSRTTDTSATLSWSRTTDAETPSLGLSYNLRIGTTPVGCEVMSPMSDPSTGLRRIVSMGNVNQDTAWTIKGLAQGKYYWSVQAIDNGYAGSSFSPVDSFEIGSSTHSVPLARGWNMLSVPVHPTDSSVASLFPSVGGNAFTYAGSSYAEKSTLSPGTGYWLKCASPETLIVSGANAPPRRVSVASGWSMVAPFDRSIPVTAINSTPADIVTGGFFGYSGGYRLASVLELGRGYWVRTTASGVLDMSGTSAKPLASENSLANDWICLSIEDSLLSGTSLYLANQGISLDAYELPPIPPEGVFDIRFATNRWVECIQAGGQMLELHSVRYPLHMRVSNQQGHVLRIRDPLGGSIFDQVLEEGKEVRINHAFGSLVISADEDTPQTFLLEQNYPNPFNPSTTIAFAVPTHAHVTLVVINILGQVVRELVNGELEAGQHEVRLDADGLASGVYLYRMQSGKFVDVKKLVLLR
jgi:hypothetical protein